jgi:hypothetical protein
MPNVRHELSRRMAPYSIHRVTRHNMRTLLVISSAVDRASWWTCLAAKNIHKSSGILTIPTSA